MKRLVTFAMVAVLVLSAVRTASAHSGSAGGHGGQCNANHCRSGHCSSNPCKNSGPPIYMGGSKNGPVGTPENPSKPTQVSSNGFVFVNGHWERPRAGQATVVDPTLTGPVVRDHRGTQSDVVVIDPNSGYRYGGGHFGATATGSASIVRDHRGTTSGTSNNVIGVGSSPVDSVLGGLAGLGNTLENGLTGIGNAFGIGYGSITTPSVPTGVRDHRTNDTSNFGYNVRDHRG